MPFNQIESHFTGPKASFEGLGIFWTGYDSRCSHKDYAVKSWVASGHGLSILRDGNGPLVMSSSGNAAYAIAKAMKRFARKGSRLVVFTDVLSPAEMVERLQNDFDFVEVIVVNEPDASGSHAGARQQGVDAMVRADPAAVEISQYGKSGSVTSFWPNGYDCLMTEIEAAFPDMMVLVLPLGTCATLLSAISYKLKHRRRWQIVGIDAVGSALIGVPGGKRIFSGYGNGKPTVWLERGAVYVARFGKVTDEATIIVSRLLLRDGLYLGASSAACVAAAISFREQGLLPHRGRTVVLCPDHGSLYTTTLFNDNFLCQNGFGHLGTVASRAETMTAAA
jgi:cysteine synthase